MNSFAISLYRHGRALLAGRGLRRYSWVNRLNELVLRLVKSREAEVLGHRMLLDRGDTLELSVRGIYEPFETRIAQELLPDAGCFVDIGANIGYYTLLGARRVGPRGQVFAFEPEPRNFALLRQNLERNGYSNTQLENAAVSNISGLLQLYISAENAGDHRVYNSEDQRRAALSIRAVRLDDYFADDIPLIDLLKMDIQGAEGHALQGMEKLLRCRPPRAVLTEFWPEGLKRAGSDAPAMLRLLETHGYRLALLDERNSVIIPVSTTQLTQEFTVGNGRQTNLLARLE